MSVELRLMRTQTHMLSVLVRRYNDCGNRLKFFQGRLCSGFKLRWFEWSVTKTPSVVKCKEGQDEVFDNCVRDDTPSKEQVEDQDGTVD